MSKTKSELWEEIIIFFNALNISNTDKELILKTIKEYGQI